MPKKVPKKAGKQLQFAFKVFLLPIALPQGQLTEVPIFFKMFTIKLVERISRIQPLCSMYIFTSVIFKA